MVVTLAGDRVHTFLTTPKKVVCFPSSSSKVSCKRLSPRFSGNSVHQLEACSRSSDVILEQQSRPETKGLLEHDDAVAGRIKRQAEHSSRVFQSQTLLLHVFSSFGFLKHPN